MGALPMGRRRVSRRSAGTAEGAAGPEDPPQAIFEDEARRLVQAASAARTRSAIARSCCCCSTPVCRVGELCGADLADVDVVEGRILSNAPRTVSRERADPCTNRRDGGPPCSSAAELALVYARRATASRRCSPRVSGCRSRRGACERSSPVWPARHGCRMPTRTARAIRGDRVLAQRPGAEIQLRSRLGHLSPRPARRVHHDNRAGPGPRRSWSGRCRLAGSLKNKWIRRSYGLRSAVAELDSISRWKRKVNRGWVVRFLRGDLTRVIKPRPLTPHSQGLTRAKAILGQVDKSGDGWL